MKVSGVFRHAKSFRDVPAGGVIFEQGASGAEMFGVMAGEVELRFPTCAGLCRLTAPTPQDVAVDGGAQARSAALCGCSSQRQRCIKYVFCLLFAPGGQSELEAATGMKIPR